MSSFRRSTSQLPRQVHVLTPASRSALTDAEKSSYLSATQCLMDPVRSPSISQYAGSKTAWGDLQVAHVAQVQFIHRVVRLFFLRPSQSQKPGFKMLIWLF
jgi:hypothetical protein